MGIQERILFTKQRVISGGGGGLELEDLIFKNSKIISKGAEAYIYLTNFFGFKSIVKVRIRKSYRNPKLDNFLRVHRTKREAKLLTDVKRIGVPAPVVYGYFPNEAVLVMEYIEGVLLYSLFKHKTVGESTITEIATKLGKYVGKMHENNMIHGDLTTSNVMFLDDGNIVLIDFGLGEYTSSMEDFGVELRVLYNSLKSAHYDIADTFFYAFKETYLETFSEAERALKKFEEIKLRGRYIEERREKRRFFKTIK